MAKLIGHHFNDNGYSLFEVDGLKETEKQYTKTKETTDGKPRFSYEYWNIMPKNQLGELRQPGGGNFSMYALQEDMPRFKALVIDRLSQRAERERATYESTVALLESAGGPSAESAAGIINKDFCGLTPEEYDKTIAGLSALEIIVAPFIMQSKSGGIEQAAEFSLDMQIAADAVKELKQQVHGAESGGEGDA